MAPNAFELQVTRGKIDEIGNRSEHDIKAVQIRSDDLMRRAEALVASPRLEEAHQLLANKDTTTSVTLSSRADDSDRRVIELTARLNATTGPFEAVTRPDVPRLRNSWMSSDHNSE